MMNSGLRTAVLFALASAATVVTTQVDAQGAPTAASGTLEEIVVTAERREANLQDTPIAIAVVSAEQLARAGVTDLRGIEAVAPDLAIRTDTLFTHLTVRGVGSFNNNELADPGVIVGLDGEYFNRPVALNASIMDLERVEVLRGPQGTLYGRNATAGVVNLVPRRPGKDVGGEMSVELGSFSTFNVNAALNVPISDTFAVRLAAQQAKHDGYIDIGSGKDADDQDTKSVRLSALLTPSESFSVLLSADFVDVDQSAQVQYGVPLTGAPFNLTTGQTAANLKVDIPQDGWTLDSAGFFKSKQKALRANVNYDFGAVDLTYLGAYRNTKVDSVNPLTGFSPERFSFENHFEIDAMSHELRLHGGGADSLEWQTGLFYSNDKQYVARGLFAYTLPPQFARGYINWFLFPNIESKSKAAFAQLSGHFSPTVKWTIGGRYTQDDKSRRGASFPRPGPPLFFTNQFPNAPTDVTQGVSLNKSADFSKATWTAGVDWQVTPSNMVYAKASTGYKSGGFDNISEFQPENLTAFEIGSKNRFLDDRIQLNAAVFAYDYKDQQVSVFIDSTVGAQVINAGKSTVRGLEVEGLFAVSEGGRLRATVNFLDAKFDQLLANEPRINQSPTPAAPLQVDLKGNRPIQSPKLTLTAGYDHTWDVGGGKLTASLSSRYKSEYYNTVFNWQADRQKAYTSTDVSLGYQSASGLWDVTVFGRNLEDERTIGFASMNGGNINIYNWVLSGAPRTFGVRAGVKF